MKKELMNYLDKVCSGRNYGFAKATSPTGAKCLALVLEDEDNIIITESLVFLNYEDLPMLKGEVLSRKNEHLLLFYLTIKNSVENKDVIEMEEIQSLEKQMFGHIHTKCEYC